MRLQVQGCLKECITVSLKYFQRYLAQHFCVLAGHIHNLWFELQIQSSRSILLERKCLLRRNLNQQAQHKNKRTLNQGHPMLYSVTMQPLINQINRGL